MAAAKRDRRSAVRAPRTPYLRRRHPSRLARFKDRGGFFHGVRSLTFGVDITQIRLMGILQRIAIAYLVTALCQIWLKGDDDVDYGLDLIKRYKYQLLAGLLITITYMALLYEIITNDCPHELVAKDLHGTEWKFRHIYRAMALNPYIWDFE
ncbi:hypothetical protein ZWY2020_020453 [Hordeum vulgare]|nr:hypothetical protein ZWY2020_020453 [Hordeum vulgare]